jgi:CheY-like chemotaxis protein/MinD-like ATPase involved in chromosome partitioning or flagellar assembly
MAGHKILVIDGDAATRNYLAQHLRKEGDTVMLAPSGNRGLVLAWKHAPDLIIADPLISDLPGEELAARLRADPRTARVPLIAFSHNALTARLRAWLESGFDDYLVKSPHVMPLLRASISDLLGGGSQLERTGGLVIAFLSAKGGLGTSSLCVNIATCIADQQSHGSVVVADLVLPMGSIAELVGYQGKTNLERFALKPDQAADPGLPLRNLPRPDLWNFSLLAGSSDPSTARQLNVVKITRLVAALKSAYDVVVLDLGRSLSPISMPLLDGADLIVMTASSDRDTVALTRGAWDFLKARDIQEASVYLLMNRARALDGLTNAEAEEAIGLPVRSAIPYMGENLSLTNHQHVPFVRHFPADAAALSLRRTAQEVVEAARRRREA